jgi:hypothetical protein
MEKSNLSQKQLQQIQSYQRWKIAKSSLGRHPHLLQYFLGLNQQGKGNKSNG